MDEFEKNLDKNKIFRIGNYIVNFFFIVLGISLIASTLLFYQYRDEYSLGPGFSIFWIGALLVIGSIVVIVQIKRNPIEETEETLPTKNERIKFIILLLLSLAALLLIKQLGMITVIFLFFLLSMKLVEEYSWRRSSWIALLGTFIMYMIFVYLFKIRFPIGILGF